MGCVYRHKGRKVWWIKYRSSGQWQYESAKSHHRADAVALLKLKEGDIARGVPVTSQVGRLRFEEASADLVNFHKARQRETKKLERRIEMHLSVTFARMKMADITPAHAEAYRVRRIAEGAATATINREVGILKQMFKLAKRGNKLMVVPEIELPAEHNVRQGFLEYDQYKAVLRHLPDELRPVVTVAYWTGWRMKSEILPLEWRHVQDGWLRLEPGTTKNREGRMFPYDRIPELRAAIDGQRKEYERRARAGEFVPRVFHRDGKPIRSLLKAFKAACKAAGVPGRIPHDLRRTAVRNLERAGVPRSQAMKLTGHLTESVYRRYAIVSQADLEDAGDRLGGLFTSKFTSATVG